MRSPQQTLGGLNPSDMSNEHSIEGLSGLTSWLLPEDPHRKTMPQSRRIKLTDKYLGKGTCLLSSFTHLLILGVWADPESEAPFMQQWLPGKLITMKINEGLCSSQEKHLLSGQVSQAEYMPAHLRTPPCVLNYTVMMGMAMHTIFKFLPFPELSRFYSFYELFSIFCGALPFCIFIGFYLLFLYHHPWTKYICKGYKEAFSFRVVSDGRENILKDAKGWRTP